MSIEIDYIDSRESINISPRIPIAGVARQHLQATVSGERIQDIILVKDKNDENLVIDVYSEQVETDKLSYLLHDVFDHLILADAIASSGGIPKEIGSLFSHLFTQGNEGGEYILTFSTEIESIKSITRLKENLNAAIRETAASGDHSSRITDFIVSNEIDLGESSDSYHTFKDVNELLKKLESNPDNINAYNNLGNRLIKYKTEIEDIESYARISDLIITLQNNPEDIDIQNQIHAQFQKLRGKQDGSKFYNIIDESIDALKNRSNTSNLYMQLQENLVELHRLQQNTELYRELNETIEYMKVNNGDEDFIRVLGEKLIGIRGWQRNYDSYDYIGYALKSIEDNTEAIVDDLYSRYNKLSAYLHAIDPNNFTGNLEDDLLKLTNFMNHESPERKEFEILIANTTLNDFIEAGVLTENALVMSNVTY